jgi:hypothetical protein
MPNIALKVLERWEKWGPISLNFMQALEGLDDAVNSTFDVAMEVLLSKASMLQA